MGSSNCCKRTCGGILILIGTVAVVLGAYVLPKRIFPKVVKQAFDNDLLLTKSDQDSVSSKYSAFVGGMDDPNMNVEYGDSYGQPNSVWMYNVTNTKAFVEGTENPNVNKVGPFAYVVIYRKYDVTFVEDHIISYKQYSVTMRASPLGCYFAKKTDEQLTDPSIEIDFEMEESDIPEDDRCPAHDTELTLVAFDYLYGIESYDPDSMAVELTAATIASQTESLGSTLAMYLKQSLYSSMVTDIRGRLLLPHAIPRLKVEFDNYVNASSHTTQFSTRVAQLNTAINGNCTYNSGTNPPCSLSPALSIFQYLNGATAMPNSSDVIFTNLTTMEGYFNENDTVAIWHANGSANTLWTRAMSDDVAAESELIAHCTIGGDTNCNYKIAGLKQWLLYSSAYAIGGWGNVSATTPILYTQSTTNTTIATCADPTQLCGWNVFDYMLSHSLPEVPFGTFSDLVALTGPLSMFNYTSLVEWTEAHSHCQGSVASLSNCASGQQQISAKSANYLSRYNLIKQSSPNSSDAEVSSYTCSLAAYVSSRLMDPFTDIVAARLGNYFLADSFNAADGYLTPNTLVNLGYAQAGRGSFSKTFMGTSTMATGLSPIEFHPYMGELKWSDVKKITDWLKTPLAVTQLYQVIKLSNRLPSQPHIPSHPLEYKKNVNADFSGIPGLPSDVASLLATSHANGTVATGIADLVGVYFNDYILKSYKLVCDDPMNCDWRRGGPFITTTMESYFYTGYVNPLLMFLVQSKTYMDSQGALWIQCANQTYFNADYANHGVSGENASLWAYDSYCYPQQDFQCMNGIHLMDLYNASASSVWSKDLDEKKYYELYYFGLTHNNAAIGPSPINALAFTAMYRDLDWQKEMSCFTRLQCGIEMNTGLKNRSEMNWILSYDGKTQATTWPSQLPFRGYSAYGPPYQGLPGLLEHNCDKRYESLDVTNEYSTVYDLTGSKEYKGSSGGILKLCAYEITERSYNETIDRLGIREHPVVGHLVPPIGFMPSYSPATSAATLVGAYQGDMNFANDILWNNGTEFKKFTGINISAEFDRSRSEIEPFSGAPIHYVVTGGLYWKIQRSAIMPNLKESYYLFPCYSYRVAWLGTPIYTQNVYDYIIGPARLIRLAPQIGISVGAVFILLGLCCCFNKVQSMTPVTPGVDPNLEKPE